MNKPESLTLHLAASTSETATVSLEDRTISGLAVPYGPVGNSSVGPITFSQGSLSWTGVGRVKFLKQHDPERVNGFAKELDDRPNGLFTRIEVPESEAGDVALLEAADGRRDGLSVGVLLSQETLDEIMRKWIEGDNSPTAASGELLEISQVSIPAFRDSRIDGSAAAALSGHVTLSVNFNGATEVTMASATMEKKMTVETSVSAPAQSEVETVTPAQAPNAVAGHAVVSHESPIYTFDGNGPSFVRDAFNANVKRDFAAAERIEKFNAMLGGQGFNPRQMEMLTAAVETRSTAPNYIQNGYKPELLIAAIDKGRPLVSRLNVVPLTDATPFRLPSEGDFTKNTVVTDGATTNASKVVTSATGAFTQDDLGVGISGAGIPAGSLIVKVNSATSVNINKAATATATGVTVTIARSGIADHTEGTAHATEGQMAIGDVTVTPGAVSGAYRLSRELVDASNPALDQVALRAMLRDYRGKTERKVVAAFVAASATAIGSLDKVSEVRGALNDFYDVMDEPATFAALSPAYYSTLLNDVDSTGRPMLASVNPMNAVGTASPGWTGANIDGVELAKSGRIAQDTGFIVKADDVLVGESAVQTFRYDEVEGPGVVKLALFAYFAAKVLRNSSVQQIASV